MFKSTDDVLSKEELDETLTEMKSIYKPALKKAQAIAARCTAQKKAQLAKRERDVESQLSRFITDADSKTEMAKQIVDLKRQNEELQLLLEKERQRIAEKDKATDEEHKGSAQIDSEYTEESKLHQDSEAEAKTHIINLQNEMQKKDGIIKDLEQQLATKQSSSAKPKPQTKLERCRSKRYVPTNPY
jgi:hypothetical protein